ncbi:UbiA family prenyltransferase [Myxococcota bacterium]|nr:UbiA family prenyltransferase [Myxococcota bacterium]
MDRQPSSTENPSLYLKAILVTARPHQWTKNIFVFAPLVFSQNLSQSNLLLRALVAFIAFSLAATSIYFFNDLKDISRDRAHPVKRLRPIPSGLISSPAASIICVISALASVSLALLTGPSAALVVLAYITINILYSLKLKHIPYLDVLIIATGFILRVSFGAICVFVAISSWILVNTLLLSLFLGFGKRYHEMVVYGNEALKQRPALAHYHKGALKLILNALFVTIPIVFVLYTFSADAQARGFSSLSLSTPLILFCLFRFMAHAGNKKEKSSPTELILRDVPFVSGTLLWVVSVILIIYSDIKLF